MKYSEAIKNRTLLFLIFFIISANIKGQEIVKNGIADIKDLSPGKEIINLKGTWEFYDNKLYTPEDFREKTIKNPEYIKVPGLWNKIKKDKNGEGYGTYRLKIINTEKDKTYAFNINKIQSSYKIWANGVLLKEEGKPGKNKKESKPHWSSSNIVFVSAGDTCEIVLQISNFYHKKGGIENPIIFGEENIVFEYEMSRLSWNFILLGIFLIMIAYHTAAFIFRRNDKSNLYFSLTLVFSAVFSMTVGEILLADIFPSLKWEFLVKTNYISNYLRVLFFALFIYHAFPKELNKTFFKIISFFTIGIIIFIIAVPAYIYTKTLFIFLIFAAIVLIYLIYGQIKAVSNRRPGALYSFLGVFILILAAVNDILKELQYIESISLTTFGVFIFIIFESYLITLQNAFSYKSIKKITDKIHKRGIIKNALFSAQSYDLKEPLKAISDVVGADRALIFIYSENDWTATNEYIRQTNTNKIVNIKVFSEKGNRYFSYYNIQKTISTKKHTYTIVNEAVKAKDMKYLEGSKIHSVFSYPLIKDGIVRGILYFENREPKKDFEKTATEILEDIKPQILVFTDNFTSYNNLKKLNIKLEKDVEEKTKEIELKTKDLIELREELEHQNLKIFETTQQLEKQTEQINDGINYSEKIQKALMQNKEKLEIFFKNIYIFQLSKSKLLNSFYWFHEINSNEIFYAVIKSKDTNVAGTLTAVLTNQLLNDFVIYRKNYSPKAVLNKLQNQFEKFPENTGAVEIAAIYFNKTKQEILFSGAGISLFYSYENGFIEYKSDDRPVVNTSNGNEKHFFSNKRIVVKEGTEIFVFTGIFAEKYDSEDLYKKDKDEILKLLLKISKNNNEEKDKAIRTYCSENYKKNVLITGITF